MTELSTDHFNRLAQQIYLRLGLHFEDKKSYFLQKRVEKRMEVLGYRDPHEYVFLRCYADHDGREMQALANLITTNETYMFREYEQLEAFANCCLPEVLSTKQGRGEQKLRIWSAGCSSGEEPYSLAIILQEIFPQSQYWDCEIVGTDIDQNMLAQAAKARYWSRSVRDVPADYLEKYFIKDGESYIVRPNTVRLVRFEHMNLHDRQAMRSMRNRLHLLP
jgi:chemotaxis protein methyltransferase CheR